MKKISRKKRTMFRRLMAFAFAFMMVVGSVAVPASEVKADGELTLDAKTLLGDARFYGIVANTLSQENHMQTNYAVINYINKGKDKGSAIPNEPDLVQGNVIPFCAANIDGYARFGQSTYYNKSSDSKSQNPRYVYDTGIGQSGKIICDNSSVALDIRETNNLTNLGKTGTIDKMIDNFQKQSAKYKGVRTAFVNQAQDSNEFYLDVTGSWNGGNYVYVEVEQGTKLYEAITKDNGLRLTKYVNQTVIFNVGGDNVKLGKFKLTVLDDSGNVKASDDTTADSALGEKNDFLREYVDEKIIWNVYEATKVDINSSAGIFLIANSASTTTISASSTGWIASAGRVENPNAEWHFPHEIIIEGTGEGEYQRPSDPPVITNPPTNLKISKKSLTTWEELEGAEFELYEGTFYGAPPAGYTLVESWVSGSDGKDADGNFEPHFIRGFHTPLKSGEQLKENTPYTLYEKKAPTDYLRADNITFIINNEGVIENVKNAATYDRQEGLIVMTDKKDVTTNDILISKKSFGEGDEFNVLPGATLALYEWMDGGNLVGEVWKTTEAAKQIPGSALKPSTKYVLVEKATPDDSKYEISSNIEFSTDAYGNVIKESVECKSSDANINAKVKAEYDANGVIVMFDKIKQSSVTPPDEGPTTLPDGTKVYPDGTKVYPDGTVEYPDGSKKLPDGTIEYPDGGVKKPGNDYIEYPNGNKEKEYPPGTKVYPDGTVEYPDGSKKLPDGTIEYPNGNKKKPDGSVEMPNGTVVKPDGSIDYEDGSKVDKDGNYIDKDGTVYPYNPANPKNPVAEYDYENDHKATPDIKDPSDEADTDFMKEFKKKGSNKQDQKNASKALKNAAAIKTGDDSQTLTSDTKVTVSKLGAKNTSKSSKKLNKKLKDYRKVYKKQKKQIAGWVTVNGTNIDYPVMYSGLKHNDKYLHKNIYGKEDTHGMIFASYLTTSRKISYNYVIYGHNMRDETMFGNLDNYGSPAFAKSHRYINVDTSKYNYVYEVVDVVRVSCAAGSKDPEIYTKFADIGKKKVYNKWKKQVKKCRDSKYKKPLAKYSNKDRLVILSTCEYTKDNGRLGVICKLKKCTKVK